ncbi:OmpA family protein [Sulfitobacter sp. D35]|uniref:OmpA family protein n=1 Tax=Sulfitobacter sp. D35 TaxID=3083252 RepID=UPI00296F3D44|nr:OmpA family protein [Sulfitobacter sp. D35]MDW4496752.1 OmpA family protein [Sulfitobacter sp. D35]
MKRILKSTTSLTLGLMLSLPAGIASAQAEAAACLADADKRVFPCALENGRVVKGEKQYKKVSKRLEAAATEATDELGDAVEAATGASETAEDKAEEKQSRAEKKAEKKEARAEKKAEKQEARAEKKAEEQQAAAQDKPAESAQGDDAQAAQASQDDKKSLQAESSDAKSSETTSTAAKSENTSGESKEQKQAQARDAEPKATDGSKMSAEEKAKLKKERRAEAKKRKRKAAAAAAAEGDSKDAKVKTEKLTEKNTRKSSEDFKSDLRKDRRAEANRDSDDGGDDDDGLSYLEQALIAGLGAYAVGSILNNGDEVVSAADDRVVVDRDGELYVLKNDDALLRRPGNEMRTETFSDGSTRTIVNQPDGSQVITIRDYDGSLLSRTLITPEGEAVVLFDDTQGEVDVVTSELPQARPQGSVSATDEDALRRALEAARIQETGRSFSLRQVRQISAVRDLAPEIELDSVRFATGSAAIEPRQAESLARIGEALRELIAANPRTVVLVEGHTDAVGDAAYNLALSDRRAESMALALTEYFDVPAENMIVQGYGESDLKVRTEDAEVRNRRAVVRNITGLLRQTDA